MKFLESVRLAIAFCGQLIRRGYPVALFNRTTRNVVLDCLNVCCREDKSKLWECLKTNRVVISKTPRAGDVTVISRNSWIAPQFIKMNTDGEFSLLNGESGGGVVFRGCSAHVLKDLSIRFGRLCSPRSAEFEALHVGLTEAIKLGYLSTCLSGWVEMESPTIPVPHIMAALSNTGIPKVHVVASASSDGQPEVDVSDEEFLQFDTSGVPVVVTLTKVGRHYIVDATSEKESQMSSAVSVSINRQGRICGLTKRGGAGLDPSIILDMISVAKHVSEQLMNKLDSEISAAEACEEES